MDAVSVVADSCEQKVALWETILQKFSAATAQGELLESRLQRVMVDIQAALCKTTTVGMETLINNSTYYLAVAVCLAEPELVQLLLKAGANPFQIPDKNIWCPFSILLQQINRLDNEAHVIYLDMLQHMVCSTAIQPSLLWRSVRLAVYFWKLSSLETIRASCHYGSDVHRCLQSDRCSCTLKGEKELPPLYVHTSCHDEVIVLLKRLDLVKKEDRKLAQTFITVSKASFVKAYTKRCLEAVREHQQKDPSSDNRGFIDWIQKELYQPRSLRRQCRAAVLRSLKGKLLPAVSSLGLPWLLQQFLVYSELFPQSLQDTTYRKCQLKMEEKLSLQPIVQLVRIYLLPPRPACPSDHN